MQLFFGTCLFFIAVILLAYVPGKLLLIALKRTLTPLEDVTLACFLGLIVSGLVYWLITFAHQARFYLVWPLATAAVFVWLQSSITQITFAPFREALSRFPKKARNSSCDRSTFVLAGVIALGMIALAFLPLYYTNLTSRAGWHDARLSGA